MTDNEGAQNAASSAMQHQMQYQAQAQANAIAQLSGIQNIAQANYREEVTDWKLMPGGWYERQVGSRTQTLSPWGMAERNKLFEPITNNSWIYETPSKEEPKPKISRKPLTVDTIAFLTWIGIICMMVLGTYLL